MDFAALIKSFFPDKKPNPNAPTQQEKVLYQNALNKGLYEGGIGDFIDSYRKHGKKLFDEHPDVSKGVLGSVIEGVKAKQAQAQEVPSKPYSPNITIPHSQGGDYTLPPELAQTLLNNFNDIGEATNAATVLNHPKDNPYIPGVDPASVNHPTYGENASFITHDIDVKNPGGSIDRGLFRINDRSFNGLMQDPYWKKKLEGAGIKNYGDMENQEKNAAVARIILERGNWNSDNQAIRKNPSWQQWFAAPHALRDR